MRYRNLANRGFVLPTRLQGSASSSYEAGSATGSRSRSWMPSASGPNTAATRNLGLIRRRARDAVANDPWAKTSVARWVSNVVGTGIQPYPKHPDPKVRCRLKAAWADWVGESDADERLDFYGQQALAARAMFVDGETLAILRPRLPSDGLTVPLQIQQLEGDHLPVDMSYSLANGHEIVNGVEFDRLNRRAAYHLYTQHPGEYGRVIQGGWETKRFDARRVVHAYQVLRPGQVRGVSDLATILLRLKTLDNFDDAVAFRQEVSNLFAGFIKKAPGDGGVDPVHTAGEYYDRDGSEILTLEPGSLQELGEGEEVQFSAPPGAPDNYMEFMRQQLMAAFASVGLPYEIASGDLRGISDRTLRVVVNEFHRLVQQYQWSTFIHQWCRPIWRSWIEAQVLAGTISAQDFQSAKRDWMRVLWVPEGWAYFNPVQDVKAKTDEIRAGLISRSAVILAQGEDPETVLDEIAADNKAADEAGLTLDSDSRHGKRGATTPQIDADPADTTQQ